MDPYLLNFLCCPTCKGKFSFSDREIAPGVPSKAFCKRCEKEFSGEKGYLDFLGYEDLPDSTNRDKMMRSLYAKVYTPATDFMFLFCGGARNARRQVLSHLELKDGDTVLETGMGPGDNLPWLTSKAKNLTIFGIDYQNQMLVQCVRNARKWNIDPGRFYRADAQELPFGNELFDVVFHLGAINLFPDKKKAIDEMIRVAKPGTRIVIADESEKAGKIFNLVSGKKDEIVPPLELIPAGMKNIRMETIWRGFGYVIAFTKP